MNFEESDEEKMFRDSVHEFAQRYVAPVWKAYDEKTHEVPRDLVVERRTAPISFLTCFFIPPLQLVSMIVNEEGGDQVMASYL